MSHISVPGAWPPEVAQRYRTAGIWRDERIDEYVRRHWKTQFGDRIAVRDAHQELSYRDLGEQIDATAGGLRHIGICAADRVIIQMDNSIDFLLAYLGCQGADAVPVLVLPAHRDYELLSIAVKSGAKALICPQLHKRYVHEDLAHRVHRESSDLEFIIVSGEPTHPDSLSLAGLRALSPITTPNTHQHRDINEYPAHVLLSGGTSGLSKLIGRGHNDYVFNIRRSAEICGFDRDTSYLAVLPAAHNFTLGCPGILGALSVGGTVILSNTVRPEALASAFIDNPPTVTSVVPTVLQRWTHWHEQHRTQAPFIGLRSIQVGGAPLSAALWERARATLGVDVQQVFGMAEGLLCLPRPNDDISSQQGTQGVPISDHDELSVRDPRGNEVAPGQLGHLHTRGPYTIRGYYGPDAHTAAESFTPDGWYRTGDLVRIVNDHIVVEGRAKDVVNRAGEKIAPREIEDYALTVPGVAEAAVVGLPDDDLGEKVGLVVRLRPDHAPGMPDRLHAAFAASRMAAFKKPDVVTIVERMPYTAVGKIDKRALTALVQSRTHNIRERQHAGA